MGIGGKDGINYKQNFDIIFKWMIKVFTGETLDVLGIHTGKIVDVCGYEPRLQSFVFTKTSPRAKGIKNLKF